MTRGTRICNVEDDRIALLRESLPPRGEVSEDMPPWMRNDINRGNALHDALDTLADDLYAKSAVLHDAETGEREKVADE